MRTLFRWLSPIRWIKTAYRWTKTGFFFLVEYCERSLRFQLILTFSFCILAAVLASSVVNLLTEDMYRRPYVDYSYSMESMDWETRDLARRIQEGEVEDNQYLQELMNRAQELRGVQMLLVDLDGKVLMKSSRATESQVDLYSVISKAMELRSGQNWQGERQEFTAFYPVELNGQKGYVIARGIPEATIQYQVEFNGFVPFSFVLVFFYLFYRFTKRKTGYIEELAASLLVISQGKLDHRVNVRGEDELGSLARNINRMTEELQENIERERRAERTKAELITNVSHDLRTPLTSVIGYLRLLRDNAGSEQERSEYTRIAYEKAEHLKRLVEDLFEYATLSGQGVQLHRQHVSLTGMLEQLVEEYVPLAEEQQLTFCKKLPADRIYVSVDPEKFVRVLENLFSNAIKYGHKPGNIDISLMREGEGVRLTVANKADDLSNEDLRRMFERFYRVEKSRSRKTGGTGLGLAIVKSIVELHGGSIRAELQEGILSFHIWLPADAQEAR